MKIYKLIRYDVRQGFRQNATKLLILAGIALLFCVDFNVRRANCYHTDGIIPKGTLMDYLFYFCAGAKEYVPGLEEAVPFPSRWFLLNSYLLYGGLSYSVRDMTGVGAVVLTKAETRWKWWLSKCVWNGMYMVASYMLMYVMAFIWCVCTGEVLSFSISTSMISRMLEITVPNEEYASGLVVYILFAPLCIMISLSILQLALSLLVPPTFSFISMEIIFVSSVYFCNGCFIGNYAMPIRSEYVKWNGFAMNQAMCAVVVLCCLAAIIGGMHFRKYDILPREN